MQKLLDELLLIVGGMFVYRLHGIHEIQPGGTLGCHLSKQVQEEAHVLLVGVHVYILRS